MSAAEGSAHGAALVDSLVCRAYRGEKTERVPVWLMRQAGRYLPEYRAVRAKHRMLDVIRTPELACEVTLQPIRRFGFDASIIFADILTPLIGMGIDLDFVEGEGPKIFNPVSSAAEVAALRTPPPQENTPYTLEAIRLVARELTPQGIPLLGFSGAPFTLSTYLLGRSSADDMGRIVRLMREQPEMWSALQEKLVTLVSEYLVAQAQAGASALQLFDSWVGIVSPSEFSRFVAPYLGRIIAAVKSRVSVPVIYFATASTGLMEHYWTLGADVFGLDWRLSFATARRIIGEYPFQGNLDPTVLAGEWSYAKVEVARILEESRGCHGFVFNLGHGILPHTPVENVERLVSMIREDRCTR